jgi:RNA polymerase primary sigma factor
LTEFDEWDDAEALTPEDISNLLQSDEVEQERQRDERRDGHSQEALEAAQSDLEDDAYRTGRMLTHADVTRAAARHRLSAANTARLELMAVEEGLVEPERQTGDQRRVQSQAGGWIGDAMDAWLSAASKFPLLSPEEEVQLARAYESGRSADDELSNGDCSEALRATLEAMAERGRHARLVLVCSNLRLVASVARGYRSDGMERVDIMQSGVLGLLRAVEKFDWRLGYKLSTYATHWIRQGVQRGIDTEGRVIRLPVHVLERIRGVKRQARQLEVRLGREPTLAELSSAVGIDVAELAFLSDLELGALSLDRPVGSDDEQSTLGDMIAAPVESVQIGVERSERSAAIAHAVDQLDPRSRKIIRLRFGLDDDDAPWTLEEVGRELGVTRERVRQLEVAALERLADTGRSEGWEA